jgi:hypothetical protein
MVLIYGESNNIKGKTPSFMKLLEERKKTIQIFTTPLKGILEEPKSTTEQVTITDVLSKKEEEMIESAIRR